MTNRIGPIGWLSFMCLLGAPIISGFIKGEPITKTSNNGIYRGQSVEVEVVDIGVSNNGFKYCTFYVKSIEKKMIGPCTDTDNKTNFIVGANYLVTKLQITNNNNIVINKAEQISNSSKVKVVKVFTKARTVLAELENSDVVGGTNLNVGDYVYR